jgi:molybdenum cofactor synthesis domain-containing protein
MPYKKKKYGIITTGGEVYAGRIKDTFTDTIREKLSEYGAQMIYHEICPDDHEVITASVGRALDRGAQMVFCTGGMSVDPDDKTPLAIKNTGAGVVTYGAPVLPGAMLMLAYTSEGVPIVGLPGCVMYAGRTVFDLILPRLMADDEIQAEELFRLGEGGLCLKCEICSYPNCGFGK